MLQERWQRIKDVLAAVEELSGAERDSALLNLCNDDPDLLLEVKSLLAQEHKIELLNEPVQSPSWAHAEPQHVGPYRVERLLGSGGMGTVYLATRDDEQYRKQVAIKVIQRLSDARLDQRFRIERQILATLEHPAIARLLDGGTLEDGRPYLVMEYVDGCPIDRYVDDHNLSVEAILQLFLKVCAAVQYAHRNLVVHRDLKAGNILVTADGQPRLLDFGIAKIISGIAGTDSDQTRPFERMLTPSSASPEQVAGGPVTTASDVYSLGLLLYRLLTGKSAYSGASEFSKNPNSVILNYDPPLASRVSGLAHARAKAVRGDLEVILTKSMEKDVSRRFQTVDELSDEIHRYLQGRPIRARGVSRFYVARKFVRRHRLQVAAVTVLLAAIAGGSTTTFIYARRAERQKEVALKRLQTLRGISESLLFEFHDSIQDLPGSTKARELVVRRTLQYLEELASEESADPSVQRDLAAAYIRIGRILASERSPHIGGPSALQNTLRAYERALAIRRRLWMANPADETLRRDLLDSLWAVASAKEEQGKLYESLQYQQERLRVENSEPARQGEIRYSLSATYTAMSDVYRKLGQYNAALDYSRRALAVRQSLLNENPGSARAQRVVALSHQFVGYALLSMRKYADAAQEHEAALKVFHTLASQTPASTDLQRNEEVAESDLCEALVRSGDVSNALPHCRRGIQIAESLQRLDPGNVQASEDTAAAYATMGFAFHQQHKTRSALGWEQRAQKIYQSALRQDPESGEAQSGLSDTLVELATIENQLHLPSACSHLQTADSVLERLKDESPADATIQSRLLDASHLKFCR